MLENAPQGFVGFFGFQLNCVQLFDDLGNGAVGFDVAGVDVAAGRMFGASLAPLMERATAQIQDSRDFAFPLLFAISVQYFAFMCIMLNQSLKTLYPGHQLDTQCLTGIAKLSKRLALRNIEIRGNNSILEFYGTALLKAGFISLINTQGRELSHHAPTEPHHRCPFRHQPH